jgi:PKD repeat protein
LSGTVPFTVTFTDASTGTPTSWAWTFGDTGTSTEQNPTHTYKVPGLYDVSLIATNDGGSDPETKTDYINAGSGAPLMSLNPARRGLGTPTLGGNDAWGP